MSSDQENRKEKLARLLTKNKTRLAFGICVELAEYSSLLTSWGFKGEGL
jgi:hypothetical protein